MTNQEKDFGLLRERIQSDLNVDSENVEDLLNLIQLLLKKNNKQQLLAELKEIYDSLDVEPFVDWVWSVYAQETKPNKDETKTPPKIREERETDKKLSNKIIGVAKLAERAFKEVRSSRDSTTEERPKSKPLRTERPSERPTERPTERHIERPTERSTERQTQRPTERPAERPNKAPLRLQLSKEKDSGTSRNIASESRRPLVKFKTASEVARDNARGNDEKKSEEKKPTSILDRIVKPSDQLKRPLPQSKEQTRTEEAYDRVIKKVKPDATSEKPKASTRPVKLFSEAPRANKEVPPTSTKPSSQPAPTQSQPKPEEPTPSVAELPKDDAPVKLKVRCRNWPHCKNENCIYHHPSENCKFFPSCPYGDKCFYIHPAIQCKFGVYCQRPNCAYIHPKMQSQYYGFGSQMARKPYPKPYKKAGGNPSKVDGKEQSTDQNMSDLAQHIDTMADDRL